MKKRYIHSLLAAPRVEFLSEPALEHEPGCGNQNHESSQIGQKAWSQKDNARQQNQQGIQQFLGRHLSPLQALSDLEHGVKALITGKKGAQESGANNDENRVKGPQIGTDFDEKIDLNKWDNCKS